MQQLRKALPGAARWVCVPVITPSVPRLVPGTGSDPVQLCELGSGRSGNC